MSRKKASITGRDNYIMAQALLYGIAQIQNLPPEQQAWSDMCDMCALARSIPDLATHVFWVQTHTQTEIDLWPDHDDDLDVRERHEKAAFKKVLATHLHSSGGQTELPRNGKVA